jgi:hypothetical protein
VDSHTISSARIAASARTGWLHPKECREPQEPLLRDVFRIHR